MVDRSAVPARVDLRGLVEDELGRLGPHGGNLLLEEGLQADRQAGRQLAELRQRQHDAVRERLAAAGVGPDEARFRSAVGLASSSLGEQAAA